MPGKRDHETKYTPLLPVSEYEESLTLPRRHRSLYSRFGFVAAVVFLLLLAGFVAGALWALPAQVPVSANASCKKPAIRQEWRSLSKREKREYIDAVQCLLNEPSRLGRNHSLYYDFAYVHYHMAGSTSHEASSFLPWHRYFVYLMHQTMIDTCGFRGQMAYWDWSLDWEDMPSSPVWDAETGFGGNGDPRFGEEIRNGHCVIDGPFANMTVPFVGGEDHPHCLSRGFAKGEQLQKYATYFRPDSLHRLLQEDDYQRFNLRLELNAHNGIPVSIMGDFRLLTAPVDPIFFLHHTQIDRLWWMWQKRRPGNLYKYNGEAFRNTSIPATLGDILEVGELGEDITVGSVMDTSSEFLCYGY